MISHAMLFIKSSVAGKVAAICFASLPILGTVATWEVFANHADAWIQAAPPTIAAITGIIALRRGQEKLSKQQTELHLTMNSRLDQLVLAKTEQADLAGAARERAEQREREARAALKKDEQSPQ